MVSYKKYLEEQLKDYKIKEIYEEERQLLEMAYRLSEERRKQGISQRDAAREAHLTQQQFSRVEKGENCNIMTYLKACHAVGLRMELKPIE